MSERSQAGLAISPPSNYKKILVGYDGSKNSQRALFRGATIAGEHGGSLRVMVVVNTGLIAFAPMAPPIPPEVFDELLKTGKDMLAQAMNAVGSAVPSVTGSVEEGNPAEFILAAALKDSTDLIVLGRRGVSGVERFLLGGVSSNVLAHSKCDVLIVR